jgi:hypothetical protein
VRVPFLPILVILGVAGCTKVLGPPDRNFRIVPDRTEYSQAEAGELGINATVTNTSKDRNFYARVGDGFNSALDQPTIYAARGTHAVIERLVTASAWESATAGVLIEGSRFVVLSAGKSYRLQGSIMPDKPGTYRIRLDYSTTNDDPSATMPFHDYSATFRVR